MKSYKTAVFSGYFISFIGISVVVFSYFRESIILFFVGAAITVIGFLAVVSLMAFNMFLKDKELELDKLTAMGFTIVKCPKCGKDNVLEDQYCIYCGEKLGSENNEV